jgi:hypothetical protein
VGGGLCPLPCAVFGGGGERERGRWSVGTLHAWVVCFAQRLERCVVLVGGGGERGGWSGGTQHAWVVWLWDAATRAGLCAVVECLEVCIVVGIG